VVKEDDEMYVWQTSLLELNGEDMGYRNSQGTFFDVIHDGSHLCIEDM
jgi:hypothetical protein